MYLFYWHEKKKNTKWNTCISPTPIKHTSYASCRQTLASHDALLYSVVIIIFLFSQQKLGCQLGCKHWMSSPDAPNNFNSMLILWRARLGAIQVWWGCSGLTKFIVVIGLMSLCSHLKLTHTDAHSLGKSSLFKLDQTTSLSPFKTTITCLTKKNTFF